MRLSVGLVDLTENGLSPNIIDYLKQHTTKPKP